MTLIPKVRVTLLTLNNVDFVISVVVHVTFVELALVLHTLGLDLELLELLPGGPAPHRPLHQHHSPPVSQVAPSAIQRGMKQAHHAADPPGSAVCNRERDETSTTGRRSAR